MRLCSKEKKALEQALAQVSGEYQQLVSQFQLRLQNIHKQLQALSAMKEKVRLGIASGVSQGWPMAEKERLRKQLDRLLEESTPELPAQMRTTADLQNLADAEIQVGKLLQSTSQGSEALAKEAENTHYRLLESKFTKHIAAATPLVEALRSVKSMRQPTPQCSVKVHISAENTARMIGELSLLQTHVSWESIVKRAQAIPIEKDVDLQHLQYDSLLIECGAILQKLRAGKRWAAEVNDLMDIFAHCQGEGALSIRGELNGLLRRGGGEDLAPYRSRVLEAMRAEEVLVECNERRRALLASLSSLGYEPVEGKMETAFVSSGKICVRKPGEDEYAVEIVADAKMALLQTELVRLVDSEGSDTGLQQQLRDKEGEENWCADHARFVEEMKLRGMNSEFRVKIPAGQEAVRTVARQGSAGHRNKQTVEQQEKARKLK